LSHRDGDQEPAIAHQGTMLRLDGRAMLENPRYPRSWWESIPEVLGVTVPARIDTFIYDRDELSTDRVYNDAAIDLVVSRVS